jgi:hypothetical protein
MKIKPIIFILASIFVASNFFLASCKKNELTDSEIPVNRINLVLGSQKYMDLDSLLLKNVGDYDVMFLSGAAFGSNSELQFSKKTSERKLVYTTSSLFDNITNLQQLKSTINNTSSVAHGADTTYNLDPSFAALPTPFYAFKTDKGKLCLMRINNYTSTEADKSVAIILEK